MYKNIFHFVLFQKRAMLLLRSFCVIFLLLFLLPSCSNKKVIEENKFVNIYSDLVIAQDTIPSNPPVFSSEKQKIFARYNVTSEEYKNTIDYYNQNSEKWKDFFDKVTAHLQSLKEKKQL
jgi:Domain of unknown function (DUF4296)